MEKLMSILNFDRKLKFLFWLAALWHDCVQLTKAIFKGMSWRCRLQQFISTRKVFHVNITFLLEVDVPQSWLMNINSEGRKLRAAPRKPCIVFLMAKITNSIAHWHICTMTRTTLQNTRRPYSSYYDMQPYAVFSQEVYHGYCLLRFWNLHVTVTKFKSS